MAWDVTGKTCLITGANTGIGRVTAIELAKRGASLVLAGRSEERTRPVVEEIRRGGGTADFIPLDLGSLASVRACAEEYVASGRPLHLLIANAGIAGFRGVTEDGFEIHFGTNHLGHFLLTCLLRERLVSSAPSRIVVVASRAHYRARKLDLESMRAPTRSLTGFAEYGESKLANVLFAAGLARRLGSQSVTSYSLHPGVVASDVWRRVPWPLRSLFKLGMISNEEGALTTLHCATAPALGRESGLYYDKSEAKKPSSLARDEALQEALWARSEEWTGCSWPQ